MLTSLTSALVLCDNSNQAHAYFSQGKIVGVDDTYQESCRLPTIQEQMFNRPLVNCVGELK